MRASARKGRPEPTQLETIAATYGPPLRRWWTALLGGYVLWGSLFFAVEGGAHWACGVPGRDWIERGADVRERLARNARYNASMECLEETPWHASLMDALFTAAFVVPVAPVLLYARRVARGGWMDLLREDAISYIGVYWIGVAFAILPYFLAAWFFERNGFVAS